MHLTRETHTPVMMTGRHPLTSEKLKATVEGLQRTTQSQRLYTTSTVCRTVLNVMPSFSLRVSAVKVFRRVAPQVWMCGSMELLYFSSFTLFRADEPAAHLQVKPVEVVTRGCVESVLIKLKQLWYACKNTVWWIKDTFGIIIGNFIKYW